MQWLPSPLRVVLGRLKPVMPTVSLLAGTGWDLFSLQRIDQLRDQFLLLATLLVLATGLVVEGRHARGHWLPSWLDERAEGLSLWIARFALGSLASATFVYFLHSASRSRSLLFVVLLAGVLVLNRYLHTRLKGEGLRIGLLFFFGYAFFSFFWPVVLQTMGPLTTVLAIGSASLLSGGTALAILIPGDRAAPGDRERITRAVGVHGAIWAGTLLTLLAATWLNLVPPVPLSIQHAGIYRDIQRADGVFKLTAQPHWGLTRRDEKVFEKRPGERVFCFAAIFAPEGFETQVTQVWLQWEDGRWVERDRLVNDVRGGRDGGFRTYTVKRKVPEGRWKVRIETRETGRLLGVVRFRVKHVPEGTVIPVVTRDYL